MAAREIQGRSHQRGQVLILFALGLVALMAMLGLALDGGNIYVNRRVAQTAADSGALAAARALSTTPPSLVRANQQVGNGLCTFVQTNNFGAWTQIQSAKYVGTDGQPLAGTNDVFVAGTTCPTPNTATGACVRPPLQGCGVPLSSVNTIPGNAAGIQVVTQQQFSTYFMGIFGLPTYSVSAQATALVGVVTQNANSSPFIICGTQAMLDDSNANVDPGGTRWSTIFGSDSYQLMSGNGPYTRQTGLWSDTPAGPGNTMAEIQQVAASPGARPSGPAFNLHGTAVQKGPCSGNANWKGLSCVADTSCYPDPPGNVQDISIPTAAPYFDPADGTNGNKVGLASNTVGPNGCGPGVLQRCILLIPVAVATSPPPNGDVLNVGALMAFWMDTCYSKDGGNNQTCGWLISDYNFGSGQSSNTWTYSQGPSSAAVVKLAA